MTGTPEQQGDANASLIEQARLLDELPVMVAHWDLSVRNVFANRTFLRWFDIPETELTGTHLGDLVPADVHARLLPHVTAALAGGSGELDLAVFDRGDRLHHLHVAVVPHRVGDEVRGFATLCTDITDRVRAQEAEHRSAHEVATFMERERIAERLHDEALQELFNAMLVLGRQVGSDPAVGAAVASVDRAIADLRKLSEHRDVDAEAPGESDPPASPWRVRELVEVLDKLPAVVAFVGNDLRVRFTNATAHRWLSGTRTSAYGLTARELLGEELYDANESLMAAALAGDEQRFVRTLVLPEGEPRVVQLQYVPNRVAAGVDGFFVLGTDLTELVEARSTLRDVRADVDRLSRAYLTLAEANRAILRAQDEQTLYAEVCRISVECGAYLGAWVGRRRAQGAGVEVVAQAGPLGDYIDGLDITVDADDPRGRGPTGISLREGRPVYSEDFLADPATRPWRPAAVTHGIAASATIPLRCNGETVAALNLYSDDPTHFSVHMRSLMEGLADNVSFALTSWHDRRQLRRLTEGD